MKASHEPQIDDMASRFNMKKNMNENNGPGFIAVTASGYTYYNEICKKVIFKSTVSRILTMNANAGPASTTSATSTPF